MQSTIKSTVRSALPLPLEICDLIYDYYKLPYINELTEVADKKTCLLLHIQCYLCLTKSISKQYSRRKAAGWRNPSSAIPDWVWQDCYSFRHHASLPCVRRRCKQNNIKTTFVCEGKCKNGKDCETSALFTHSGKYYCTKHLSPDVPKEPASIVHELRYKLLKL